MFRRVVYVKSGSTATRSAEEAARGVRGWADRPAGLGESVPTARGIGHAKPDGGLRREIETLRGRISRLSAASVRISSSLDVETVLREIVGSARALTGARCGGIVTIDDAGEPQDFVSQGITPDEHRQVTQWTDGPGFFEHLRDLEAPLRRADLATYLRALGYRPLPVLSGSLQATPMRHRGRRLGTFCSVSTCGSTTSPSRRSTGRRPTRRRRGSERAIRAAGVRAGCAGWPGGEGRVGCRDRGPARSWSAARSRLRRTPSSGCRVRGSLLAQACLRAMVPVRAGGRPETVGVSLPLDVRHGLPAVRAAFSPLASVVPRRGSHRLHEPW